MAFHECPECHLIHGDVSPQTNPDVEIARINAESALAIARLGASADKHVAEVEAESAVDVAEAQAEVLGAVLAAAPEGDASEEVEEPQSGPVVVSTPIIDSGNEVEETEPPKREENEGHHEEAPAKARGFGMW
jgi:hypothetical protein